jgi:predicted RNA-binding Zn ribbon-like protein
MDIALPLEHRHDATLEATFDFLNTDELDGAGHPVERLPSLVDATGWLADHGLLHPEARVAIDASTIPRDHDLLAHVHKVRAALREIVEALVAERQADPPALATVNAVLRARGMVELVPSEGCFAIGHRHVGDPLDGALAGVAEPLVSLVASGDPSRLRICANDGCRWVFHDTSRTGRRRWCSMSSCGNRAKAARHRARRRAGVGAPVKPAPVAGAGAE